MRRILHIDMDAFFASVEIARDPSLKGKPLIIGGDKTDLRGVVSTASYEARVFGVRSAMPLAQARKLCPHGIYMRGNHALYHAASREVRRILEAITPTVEFASIDEAYLDITGSLEIFGGDDGVAHTIKSRIRDELNLPCTVAIAANKLVAKIGANLHKPDGYTRVPPGTEAEFLAPLPIGTLPGVGPRTRELLTSLGIQTIGDLANYPENQLLKRIGNSGYNLKRAALGQSNSPVEPRGTPKSISRETTFEIDLSDWAEIERVLFALAERAGVALRSDGLEAKCITLKVRYTGFDTHTHSFTLPEPSCLDRDFFAALRTLIPKARQMAKPVRLIGVNLGSLREAQRQATLFDNDRTEQWERAAQSVDALRKKLGPHTVRSARTIAKTHREPSTE